MIAINNSKGFWIPKFLNFCSFKYSHPLTPQMTDTLAMAKWSGTLQPDQNFELRISVAEVNRPRMWVEKSGNTEAAMLTFYPDISVSSTGGRSRVKIFIDCSKSMECKWKGMQYLQAKCRLFLVFNRKVNDKMAGQVCK